MNAQSRTTVYARSDYGPVAGEPGKSGLHGDWLACAKELADGASTRLDVILAFAETSVGVDRALDQMISAHIVRVDGDQIWLSPKGLKRLAQAEANGR